MAERTTIGWCDRTWNPWWGCTKVSPACDPCYAEALDKRYGGNHWGPHAPRKRTSENYWAQPAKWDRADAKDGARSFVFCASMADIFDNQVDPQWRADAFAVMRATPNLVWLLLTKRPGLIQRLSEEAGGLPANAALGCTVVTQEEADRDIWKLLSAGPALFRFLSIEPMLGPVTLTNVDPPSPGVHGKNFLWDTTLRARIDWVICGGMSGPDWEANPMPESWARGLRDECAENRVPFYLKQWSAFRPKGRGCALDGREWKERPQVPPLKEPARDLFGAAA